LALPNPSKPYHLFTDEASGIAKGVLTQLSGPIHQPIACLSRQLDPAVMSPGDHVLLKQLHPRPLQPRWTGPSTVILTTPSAAKLLGHTAWYHLTCLKSLPSTTSTKTWQLHRWGPLPFRSPRLGMLLILLLTLPLILSEPSLPYCWRFKIKETVTKGKRVTTQIFDSGECPPHRL
jgi:hypothetical protein